MNEQRETQQPTVLVTASSKHGSTAEIATVLGEELAARGISVVVRPPEQVESVAGFRACVVGSAIYGGRWRKDAAQFVLRNAEALRELPVWLFSSGGVGAPPKPAEPPADVVPLLAAVGAREHRVFAGRLERSRLGLLERQAIRAVKASYGDFRDWDQIRAWADQIADALQPAPSA